LAFKRLADTVVKHYKLIIAIWIVVLFYVFPLIFKINDVVVYNESTVGLEGLDSIRAQEVIDQNFAGQVPPSTIMIVVTNSNVTTSEVRDFTWTLYGSISDSRLPGVISVNYLYDALTTYYANLAVQAWDIRDQTEQTCQLVFGLPVQIAYGHVGIMTQPGNLLNESQIRGVVIDGIHGQLVLTGADNDTIALTMNYASSFYDDWLNWTVPYPLDNENLTSVIRLTSAQYFGGTIGGDVGAFSVGVSQGLDASNYSSSTATRSFVEDFMEEQLGVKPSFVQDAWVIGHRPSETEAIELARTTIFSVPFDQLPVMPEFLVSQFVNIHSTTGRAYNTMLIIIPLSVNGSSDVAMNDVRSLRAIVKQHLELAGPDIDVYVSGDPALNVDLMDAVDSDLNKIDMATVGLVVVLVFIFFRSIVTPWIPLMTVGMAFLVSTAVIYLMGTYVLEIHYSVLTIMLTVMLGAGTDYCIFIMSRYREERVLGRSKEDAVRTSLMWAGESIATSGATVMIGFGALMIGSYSLIRSMGMALVIAVGIALLFALTMLPSLLMLIGDKVFWPNRMDAEAKRMKDKDARGGGYFRKSARFALKRRKAIVIAALIISVPAIYLLLNLESSYDFISGLPETDSTKGLNAMGEGFGKGNIMPTYVVVTFQDPIWANGSLSPEAAAQLESYCVELTQMPDQNVRSVSGPTRPFGSPVNDGYIENLSLFDRATYEHAIENAIGNDQRTVLLTVVLQDEPLTTKSIHTIDKIRELDSSSGNGVFSPSTRVLVGGSTASMTDVSRSVSADFFTMRFVVVVGIYFVLMIVLGSLVIPLRLILTVLLTVVWTIAATMILFEFGFGLPVLWMMPLILFVIALGLGMDYDIFLTTRIREEVSKGKTDEEAIVTAVERTGGIITACGVVMAGAFGSMLLSSTALLKEFGFGLAFAILLDAMIVRIYLVPAIMLMLQKWNWYAPGRLQRVRREDKARKPPRKT